LTVPVATAGTSIYSNAFTANWGAVTNATSYALDVATNNTFSTSATIASEGFENTMTVFSNSGGAYFTGTAVSPATNRYSSGSYGFGVNNVTAT
jgi:hypothetical protein